MKFGKKIMEETEEIQMAPLIDIVFLTLVFFMIISVYASLESELDIQLPTAGSSEMSMRSRGEIYINVKEDGSIVLNNRVLDLAELQQVLNQVAEYFPGGAVILRGDKGVDFGRAVAVLDCCKRADIQNVQIAALKEDAKEVS